MNASEASGPSVSAVHRTISHGPGGGKLLEARLFLPPGVRGPLAILISWIIPQICLWAVNLRAWHLASEEVDPGQRSIALWIGGMNAACFLAGVAILAWMWWSKRRLPRLLGAVPVVLVSIALSIIFVRGQSAIPAAIADWMLRSDEWMLKQFTFLMPAALFGAIRLLCPDNENSVGGSVSLLRAMGLTVLFMGGSVGGIFLPGLFAGFLDFYSHGRIPLTALYLIASILASGALLRVCLTVYIWTRSHSWVGLAALTAIVALVAPIGGLILNAAFPFPSDFQLPSIYIATVVNALVLLLPNFSNPVAHRTVWLLQCLLFPFSAYFFAVFVPFMTIAPLGLIFFGAGALVYVPSLLFCLHGYKILDGFRLEIRDSGRLVPAVLGVVAILAWPIGYTVQALGHRASLHQALDYLQYPDYSRNARYEGNLDNLRSSLHALRDFKEGFYLPYLSEYYNWLTFDNLVLPAEKLNSLYTDFFGDPLPQVNLRQSVGFLWNNRRSTSEMLEGPQGTRPSANAVVQSIKSDVQSHGGASRLRASIVIQNPTAETTEFATTIFLPPGVLISGLWLTVGTEKVPGRIFEKRSALWVYQKITEVRPVPRDPAILRYTTANEAELRVYPVEVGVPRYVEIEFLYPENLAPNIQIGYEPLLSEPQNEITAPFTSLTADGHVALVAPDAKLLFPSFRRTPYLHVLIDSSKDSALQEPAALKQALARLATNFPQVTEFKLSFINFETIPFRNGATLSAQELAQLDTESLIKATEFRGGVLMTRAIKEVLWQHVLAMQSVESKDLQRFPQIVVLQGADQGLPKGGELSEFAALVPDSSVYWVGNMSQLEPVPFGNESAATPIWPVQILQTAGQRFVIREGKPAFQISAGSALGDVRLIEAFDPSASKFFAGSSSGALATEYSSALKPWEVELNRIFQPFLKKSESLSLLLKLCRETGVLVPSATYMVVENTAQWKMLEEAEKKALKGHEALEMSATPEPSTFVLMALGLFVLVVRVIWLRRRAATNA